MARRGAHAPAGLSGRDFLGENALWATASRTSGLNSCQPPRSVLQEPSISPHSTLDSAEKRPPKRALKFPIRAQSLGFKFSAGRGGHVGRRQPRMTTVDRAIHAFGHTVVVENGGVIHDWSSCYAPRARGLNVPSWVAEESAQASLAASPARDPPPAWTTSSRHAPGIWQHGSTEHSSEER